ncbi:MAG: hypothetical protein ACLPND_14630 [Candidatus Korobacteraceae bacterium]
MPGPLLDCPEPQRPSPFRSGGPERRQSWGRPDETTLKTERIQIERKTFILTLKDNPRGRFLRITEEVNGRRDNIIIPSTGLEEFKRLFQEMIEAEVALPRE